MERAMHNTPRPTVYVVGDAGHDEFALANQKDCKMRVPSGALFVATMLDALLSHDNINIAGLVKTGKQKGRPSFKPLEAKRATLEQKGDVWRISSYDPAEVEQTQLYLSIPETKDLTSPRVLVAHHAQQTSNAQPTSTNTAALARCFPVFLDNPPTQPGMDSGLPDILVNICSGFPTLNRDECGSFPVAARASSPDPKVENTPFESAVWNILFKHRERVGIVLSLSTLRAEGGAITRRLSWEQGIEDLTAELHLFPRLSKLSEFRHLFIRLGMVGFVHIERRVTTDGTCNLSGQVFFDPNPKDGIHRDHEDEGGTIGRNTLLIAALARSVLNFTPPSQRADGEFYREAFEQSLMAMRRVDDKGYNADHFNDGDQLIRTSAEEAKPAFNSSQRNDGGSRSNANILSWREIPEYLLNPPLPNALRSPKRWHILDDMLLEAPVHRVNVAMAIVKAGEKVLNRVWCEETDRQTADKPIWELLTRAEYWTPEDRAPDYVTLEEGCRPATPPQHREQSQITKPILGDVQRFELNVPLMQIEKLTLIERDEIESLRGIKNLLTHYRHRVRCKESPENNPISIAVFGPPGSGKSFGVKQIAESLGDNGLVRQLEFNVAQFQNVDDLAACFHDVVTVKTDQAGVTPLVFFDEFDCEREGTALGWLKYFLAPMQDGLFRYQNESKKIGPAIFVFAGGVHASFERFDPRTDTAYDNLRDSEEYKTRLRHFVDQKGPDFISRLRGNINVLEINEDPGHTKHFIRRAFQLRSLLKKNNRILENGFAQISNAVVYALLTVDRYRHGMRSMQAIVEMCTPIYNSTDIASLPPRAQLNMHVDAEEFLIRVHRGRARDEPGWNLTRESEIKDAIGFLQKAGVDVLKVLVQDCSVPRAVPDQQRHTAARSLTAKARGSGRSPPRARAGRHSGARRSRSSAGCASRRRS